MEKKWDLETYWKNRFSITKTIFLTVGLNNFGNKIPNSVSFFTIHIVFHDRRFYVYQHTLDVTRTWPSFIYIPSLLCPALPMLWVSIRCLMVSTNQTDPGCFYFRISWILMEQHWFYFFHPLHFLQGLRSLKY